jgi:hypothetical protein
VGGWTAVQRRCWLSGLSVVWCKERSATGTLASAAAALVDAAHGATREHSESGQCEQSWSDPGVHDGVANGSESWLAWDEEPEATEAWLSQ